MARTLWIWMAAAVLAVGCSAPPASRGPTPALPAADADYASPPEPRAAGPAAGGGIQLSGMGRPDSLIRLASPDGSALGVAASQGGAWSLALPAATEPRLYSLSEDVAGRPLRARGYVAVWSAPAPGAALLRPGAAATPLRAPQGLTISGLDLDISGAAIISGWARPNETVRLSVDGADPGEDTADADGRFVHSLPRALAPGAHVLTAQAGGRRAEVRVEATPAGAMTTPPYAAQRQATAWRIDWMTPGGGVQTTLVFDPPGAGQ